MRDKRDAGVDIGLATMTASSLARWRMDGTIGAVMASDVIDPAIVSYLCGLKQQGVQLGLDRMQGFVAALGHPQDRVPVVHIAGTNGKGSVAAMLEAIFRGAGWRTGLYTSPHLVHLGERIQVDREPLTAAELTERVRELQPLVERHVMGGGAAARPTYFEFMTALAFVHFAQMHCDIAIIEVGMGGRLDATNVVNPEVSVITSIGLDHTEFLGGTLEAIAAEKAGIIKRGRPVVLGPLRPEAERVIRAAAEAQYAAVASVREEFSDDITNYPRTNLPGEFQRANAATAQLVARQFDSVWRIGDAHVARALQAVDWPARWQRLEIGGRQVVIDGSHNRDGAAVLEQTLAELARETKQRPVVAVGVLGASRARPLLEVIGRHAAEIRLLRAKQLRACTVEELRALIPANFRGSVVPSTLGELFPSPGACLPGVAPAVPLVVTGSIYLAGEALAAIDPTRGPVEHELQDF
jgi:dihydrofolate synthase/folylpolyglutamate synthase